MSKSLTNEEIRQFLDESEDGLDFDADDDVDDPNYDEDLLDADVDEFEEMVDNILGDIEDENMEMCLDLPDEAPPILQESTPKQKKRYNDILWKKKNLVLEEHHLRFTGNKSLPDDIKKLHEPIEYFFYLFPKEFLKFIANETNLYIAQKDINDNFRASEIDIQQFIGVVYMMSLVQLPNVASHWSEIGTSMIQETMPLKKFEYLRRRIHFNDNTKNLASNDKNFDRMYKIRPILDELNKNFAKVPLEEHLCVDEQICSTKARNLLKRYLPNKPHKWGYKIYVLCGSTGFAYKIEPETGKENIVGDNEPDLGASSNVVMRLSRMIPRNNNYKLYFDNYFTSIPLLVYLANEGVFSVGTIRRNRIPNCKLESEKAMMKKDRGSSIEFVGCAEGIEISTVSWRDNKIVNLASTFVGEMPKRKVKRYDKIQKRYVEIDRPSIVGEYNAHMGGVDLIDSIMGRYKIKLRSKRWQIRVFYHLLDLLMANAWLLYKKNRSNDQEKLLPAAKFRLNIAQILLKYGKKINVKNSKSLEPQIQAKKRKGPAQHAPPQALRLDQVGHWPIWTEKRIRCKMPNCQGVTQTMCEKCGVALCYNKQNNCYRAYHLS